MIETASKQFVQLVYGSWVAGRQYLLLEFSTVQGPDTTLQPTAAAVLVGDQLQRGA